MLLKNNSSDIVAIALCSFVLGVLGSVLLGLGNTVIYIQIIIRFLLSFIGL